MLKAGVNNVDPQVTQQMLEDTSEFVYINSAKPVLTDDSDEHEKI